MSFYSQERKLQWPIGWRRTPPEERTHSRYRVKSTAQTARQIREELRMMGAEDIRFTWDSDLRRKYRIDPGVSVFWSSNGQPSVIACDKWETVAENLRACLYAISSLRQLERCGASEILSRAFAGFALPAEGESTVEHWRSVMGFDHQEDVSASELRYQYITLSKIRHPDQGGSDFEMAELNRAYQEGKEEHGY